MVAILSNIFGLHHLELVEDAVQDTFLKLCQADRDRIDGYLKAWLFKVCRNRALEIQRKERRMSTLTTAQADNRQSSVPSPAVQADRNDQLSAVQRFMTGLPEKQQEVIHLKYQNGLSYKEISDVAEISVSNVGYLLHTALQSLRTQMQSL